MEENTTVKYITYHIQRTDIATPKLCNPCVGAPSKTTKSDTKTSCKNILSASKYNSHTEPLFKQTNILKVTDICTLNEIKLYYKLINKQLPQYFNSFTCEANSDIHGYNTRTRNKLHTLKTNHDFAQKSLRYRIIQTVNKLPDNVIGKMRTHIIYGLTNYAKKYFISSYKTECTIENGYTCQCSMR